MRNRKITIPSSFCYQTEMTVQVSDINYGGHVGNERYLLFAQETRMRFLQTIGHTEINFGEFGIVVAEAGIEYFTELFHGDIITISISIDNISRVAFDCYYKIEKTLLLTLIDYNLLTIVKYEFSVEYSFSKNSYPLLPIFNLKSLDKHLTTFSKKASLSFVKHLNPNSFETAISPISVTKSVAQITGKRFCI